VVESNIKRNARINCISHLLSEIPYERGEKLKIEVPERQSDKGYVRPPRDTNTYVPDAAATLLAAKKRAGKKPKD
jgi:hypothetical protein